MRSRASVLRMAVVCAAALGLVLLGCGIAASPASAANEDFAKINERIIDSYLLPHFQTLADESALLGGIIAGVCAGDAGKLTDARGEFEKTALSWAAVDFLRMGPMAQIGRAERFHFWPDARNVTPRQVGRLVASRDESALDPQVLLKKSAAVQGLGALELLLYDDKRPITDTTDDGRYRCRLAVAAAEAVQAETLEVIAAWSGADGWRTRLLQPGVGNSPYKTTDEVTADFARAFITGLQMILDREIVQMEYAAVNPARKPLLVFARSGLTARYIVAKMQSLRQLYDAMDLAAAVPKDKSWMSRWISGAFDRLSDEVPDAISNTETTGEVRSRRLRILRFQIDGIRKLVGREMATLAGLTIGFNELDGD
ncbi:Iron-regulated protein A precursor [Hyphomicrobium sulfonivorans]|uniref:Iron-regulated protein A n=1 Tax=Hyphomicrobium sulfonivorans TaxID=121290 RepID=A0A125NVD6_HYPSL|nr:imelysin family protein [Hyphomicrobium sulfonivorans]KWT69434.1 Iron-regulated protein A precursor [Hyphomicrobium sulfonivorans]